MTRGLSSHFLFNKFHHAFFFFFFGQGVSGYNRRSGAALWQTYRPLRRTKSYTRDTFNSAGARTGEGLWRPRLGEEQVVVRQKDSQVSDRGRARRCPARVLRGLQCGRTSGSRLSPHCPHTPPAAGLRLPPSTHPTRSFPTPLPLQWQLRRLAPAAKAQPRYLNKHFRDWPLSL